MFDNLSTKLDQAFKTLKGQGKITEINVASTIKEIRRALIDADVNFKVAKENSGDRLSHGGDELPLGQRRHPSGQADDASGVVDGHARSLGERRCLERRHDAPRADWGAFGGPRRIGRL